MPCKKNSTRRRVRSTVVKTETVNESPVRTVVSEAPVSKVVKEAPVSKVIKEPPVSEVVSEPPVKEEPPRSVEKVGVIIPIFEEPAEVHLKTETWIQEATNLLKSPDPFKTITCQYLEPFGYKVILVSNYNGYAKRLLYNSMATNIAKVMIYGPAIVIRTGDAPFTLEDLTKVDEIATNVDREKYHIKAQSRLSNLTNELAEMKQTIQVV